MLLERGPEVTRRHRCRYTHTPALVNPASRHQAPKRYTEGSSIYEQARTLSCLAMGGNRTMISQAGIAVCTRRFTLTRGAGRRKDSFHHRTVPRKRPHGLTVPAGVPPVLGLRRAKDGAANTMMSEAIENWAVPYSCCDSLFCILERLHATDTLRLRHRVSPLLRPLSSARALAMRGRRRRAGCSKKLSQLHRTDGAAKRRIFCRGGRLSIPTFLPASSSPPPSKLRGAGRKWAVGESDKQNLLATIVSRQRTYRIMTRLALFSAPPSSSRLPKGVSNVSFLVGPALRYNTDACSIRCRANLA